MCHFSATPFFFFFFFFAIAWVPKQIKRIVTQPFSAIVLFRDTRGQCVWMPTSLFHYWDPPEDSSDIMKKGGIKICRRLAQSAAVGHCLSYVVEVPRRVRKGVFFLIWNVFLFKVKLDKYIAIIDVPYHSILLQSPHCLIISCACSLLHLSPKFIAGGSEEGGNPCT